MQGIHFTTIHKAIKRLPEVFLEEAMQILAEMTSKSPITAIVDATIFTLSCYEERIVKLKETKVRVTVKLSALWGAKTHVFHSAKVIKGVSRATSSFKHINGCRVKRFADSEFPSRPNLQLCANKGIKGVIKPQKNKESKGLPSMERVRKYQVDMRDGRKRLDQEEIQ